MLVLRFLLCRAKCDTVSAWNTQCWT